MRSLRDRTSDAWSELRYRFRAVFRRQAMERDLEEELRFLDQAYAQGGQIGLTMQTLLETGARVSAFVALRVEDVSLAERVITIEDGKGGKRREVPIRPELALHIGRRRAGPLFLSRQTSKGGRSRIYTRQRVGQLVRGVVVFPRSGGELAAQPVRGEERERLARHRCECQRPIGLEKRGREIAGACGQLSASG